jgi:hypothetical protein
VETQGLAHLEGAGRERRVVSFIGTVADITERKHSEELLLRQADCEPVARCAFDVADRQPRHRPLESRGRERLYGYTGAEAEGRRTTNCSKLAPPSLSGTSTRRLSMGGAGTANSPIPRATGGISWSKAALSASRTTVTHSRLRRTATSRTQTPRGKRAPHHARDESPCQKHEVL